MPTELEQRLHDSLKQTARRFPPPPDLRERVEARVASNGRRRRLLAAAAVVVLVVATAGVAQTVDVGDDQRVTAGPGAEEHPGNPDHPALSVTYVPPGFGLAEDVEHRRHPLGDRLRIMTWARDNGGERQTFEIHRRVGSPLDLAAELRLQANAQPATVRDHTAVLVHHGPLVSLSWLPHDDVTLSVVSSDLSELELLQVAEGIIYHPEHDDLSLPDTISPVDPGDGNRQLERATVVAEGEVEGMRWELLAYPSDSGLCVDLRFWRTAGGGCGHEIGAQGAVSVGTTNIRGFRFAHGPTRRDVATVRLELSNGDTLEVRTTNTGSFDVNFYATSLPSDGVVRTVVALDEQGGVLQEFSGADLP